MVRLTRLTNHAAASRHGCALHCIIHGRVADEETTQFSHRFGDYSDGELLGLIIERLSLPRPFGVVGFTDLGDTRTKSVEIVFSSVDQRDAILQGGDVHRKKGTIFKRQYTTSDQQFRVKFWPTHLTPPNADVDQQANNQGGVDPPQPANHDGVNPLANNHRGVDPPQPANNHGGVNALANNHRGVDPPQPANNHGGVNPLANNHDGIDPPQPANHEGIDPPQPANNHEGIDPPQPANHEGVDPLSKNQGVNQKSNNHRVNQRSNNSRVDQLSIDTAIVTIFSAFRMGILEKFCDFTLRGVLEQIFVVYSFDAIIDILRKHVGGVIVDGTNFEELYSHVPPPNNGLVHQDRAVLVQAFQEVNIIFALPTKSNIDDEKSVATHSTSESVRFLLRQYASRGPENFPSPFIRR
eukprot:scaffold1772_cov34-Cyclotella_meneghiniana.AAC.4